MLSGIDLAVTFGFLPLSVIMHLLALGAFSSANMFYNANITAQS